MKLRKLVAMTLATMMVLSSAATAMAATSASDTGQGSFEGGEIDYPTLQVTLPTAVENTYDYIADPNDLINVADGKTDKYNGATFTNENNGYVYFKTSDAEYKNTSKSVEITNENARDIDVTVELSVKTAGDESIVLVNDKAAWGTDYKKNEMYLALTDGAASNPKTAGLTKNEVGNKATLSAVVEGQKDNYELGWNTSSQEYAYTLKDSLSKDWNKTSFSVTGAINTNAEWAEEILVPEIEVTWSYAEHQDKLTVSTASKSVAIPDYGTLGALQSVTFVKTDGSTVAMTQGTHYTYSGGTFAVVKDASVAESNVGTKFTLQFANGSKEVHVVSAT